MLGNNLPSQDEMTLARKCMQMFCVINTTRYIRTFVRFHSLCLFFLYSFHHLNAQTDVDG